MTEPDMTRNKALADRGKPARGGGGSDDGRAMLEPRLATLEADM